MKAYEVKLSRTVQQKVFATVSVDASTPEAAGQIALNMARTKDVGFAAPIDQPIEDGQAAIISVEEIVDLDERI